MSRADAILGQITALQGEALEIARTALDQRDEAILLLRAARDFMLDLTPTEDNEVFTCEADAFLERFKEVGPRS